MVLTVGIKARTIISAICSMRLIIVDPHRFGTWGAVESIIKELKRQPDMDKSDEEIEREICEVCNPAVFTTQTF